jgi:hypothetical protein
VCVCVCVCVCVAQDYVSTLDRMPGGSVAQATTPGRSTRKLRRVSTVSWLFGNSKMVNAPGDEEVPPPPLASDEERIADVRSRFLQVRVVLCSTYK